MKIFTLGLNLEPGKKKYQSQDLEKLADKFKAKKITSYQVEFWQEEPEKADLAVVTKEKLLDFILFDLEKIEKRLERAEEEKEKEALTQAQNHLEAENLLSSCQMEEEKRDFLNNLQLVTLKSVLVKEGWDNSGAGLNELIAESIEAAGRILFFTASEKEARAWDLKKGLPVLEAAGRIHGDLKKGFIRAEVVNCRYLDDFYNLAEAKKKGLVKTVNRDYFVEANDIIQVRFNL